MPRERFVFCFLLVAFFELGLAGMVSLGDLGRHIPAFFLCYGLLGVVFVAAIFYRNNLSMYWVWGGAILFRVTLLPYYFGLSDDIFRYVWDGRVLAWGINPYQYAPNAEALVFLQDEVVHPFINHPELPTIYPPVAQLFFFVSYLVSGSVFGFKVLVVVMDLLIGWILVRILDSLGKNRRQVLIYLWHPLVVIEGAGSGHMDFIGVGLMMFGVYAWLKHKDGLAFGLLGGAVLSKFLPLVLLPFFLRWKKKAGLPDNWGKLLWFAGIIVVGYLPFVLMDGSVWGSLGTYGANWEFNSPVFWGIKQLMNDGFTARCVIAGLFGLWVIYVFFRIETLMLACFWVLAGFLVLTPTLHPWYVIWLIPFLVFHFRAEWVGFSLVVVFAYHVLMRYKTAGLWEESRWIWGIEYGTLIFIWLFAFFLRQKRRTVHLDEKKTLV